jgi:hypothetical protein
MKASRMWSKMFKKGQTGQSIVILAIGFLALLAFVGIVTDVSLLFVRYSTLRRAVDAAAIAAAGQMRRVVDDSMTTENEIQAASLANLNLAARQFIEYYGLNPQRVLVETCYTQDVARTGTNFDRPLDRNGVELYLYNAQGSVTGDNPAAVEEDRLDYEELCTRDELKLVRVTAQIESPTVFLYLFGFRTVTLQESAISQTAVIDVVLMLDVSESMVYNTDYDSYEAQNYWDRYYPPQVRSSTGSNGFGSWWEPLLSLSQADILSTYFPGGIQSWRPGDAPTDGTARTIRNQCQARIWPRSQYNQFVVPLSVYDNEYASNVPTNPPFQALPVQTNAFGERTVRSVGFVPTFDYYGCCNDPDGDGNFEDLVCEPFRIVRDSANNFLQRLDFIRGDRVALLTFDRTAHLMDPDGPSQAGGIGLQNAFIETVDDIPDPSGGSTPLRIGASIVLNERIGVRSEPSFYVDMNNDGVWDGFRLANPTTGGGTTWSPGIQVGNTIIDGSSTSVTYLDFDDAANYYDNVPTNLIFDHPVREGCAIDGAFAHNFLTSIDYYTSGTAGQGDARPAANGSALDDVASPPWINQMIDPRTGSTYTNYRQISYEFRAACRGTNIAASLEEAAAAFYLYGRREGSVWIMVLLSDGAAGGSDPVRRQYFNASGAVINTAIANAPNLYNGFQLITADTTGTPHATPGYGVSALPGEYGAYGLCPYGVYDGTQPTTELREARTTELVDDTVFPYCSDEDPSTRFFCGTDTVNPRLRPINTRPEYIADTARNLTCEQVYDVDDYARDWADFIGLANLNVAGTGNQLGDERLPTIFTIGFGLPFANTRDNPTECGSFAPLSQARSDCNRRINNVGDYLGEELLRYIADVGDNSRLDNDYWQQVMNLSPTTSRIPNPAPSAGGADWGPPGECENTTTGSRGSWRPESPATACGNYFVVADVTNIGQLDAVFNQISSRMFTRLAQ